jgi:hypothetical protein
MWRQPASGWVDDRLPRTLADLLAVGCMIFALFPGAAWAEAGGPDPDAALEAEIQAELERQAHDDAEARHRGATAPPGSTAEGSPKYHCFATIDTDLPPEARTAPADRRDPTVALPVTDERWIPSVLFDVDTSDVRIHYLDADRDGRPEVIRRHDGRGALMEERRDTDYDGIMDRLDAYVEGTVRRSSEDTNFDGAADLWLEFGTHWLQARQVDRDFDGRPNTVYVYDDGALYNIWQDTDGDGTFERWEAYHPDRRDGGEDPSARSER